MTTALTALFRKRPTPLETVSALLAEGEELLWAGSQEPDLPFERLSRRMPPAIWFLLRVIFLLCASLYGIGAFWFLREYLNLSRDTAFLVGATPLVTYLCALMITIGYAKAQNAARCWGITDRRVIQVTDWPKRNVLDIPLDQATQISSELTSEIKMAGKLPRFAHSAGAYQLPAYQLPRGTIEFRRSENRQSNQLRVSGVIDADQVAHLARSVAERAETTWP